jgi:hypothetical protein
MNLCHGQNYLGMIINPFSSWDDPPQELFEQFGTITSSAVPLDSNGKCKAKRSRKSTSS